MSSVSSRQAGDIRLFLALSRTPHLLADLAAPCVAALLSLGKFPDFSTIALGLVTVYAGYSCVYALNDVTDYQLDRQRLAKAARDPGCFDLDCVFVRHPLAQGLIPLANAVAWTALWGLIALAGAALLHPLCAMIFVVGALLEVVYCKLYRLSQWKILLAAVIKTLGGLAAIFAVNPQPRLDFVLMFFLWIGLWEVGGQNIPNDLVDMEEDRLLGAKTIPLAYGSEAALALVLAALTASFAFGLALVFFSPLPQKPLYLMGGILSGTVFLLLPLRRFLASGRSAGAVHLFNRASLYPLGILCTSLVSLLVQYLPWF